jgi:hypothetical protein
MFGRRVGRIATWFAVTALLGACDQPPRSDPAWIALDTTAGGRIVVTAGRASSSSRASPRCRALILHTRPRMMSRGHPALSVP